jgi:peptide chain release factor 2
VTNSKLSRTSAGVSTICGGIFDIPNLRARLEKYEAAAAEPGFWDDQERARTTQRKRTEVLETLTPFNAAATAVDDCEAIVDLAREAGDDSLDGEVAPLVADAAGKVAALEFRRMLSGENDAAPAIVEINAGAGGTESNDWASMLLRMYLRYCERKGWKVELVQQLDGDEAGIKSATLTVEGAYAYGYLKAESGVHRLVRISPFDSQARRHTSFASVSVVADIEEDIAIEINEADVRVDTMRASGAGGQKVNKTDSAIRLTHIPTGIVVSCQNERSQHKNRALAFKILKARMYEREKNIRDAEKNKLEGLKTEIGFGHQIRSYVLQPYRLVKDLRTGHTAGNVDAILDGEIEDFVIAYLMRAGTGTLGEAVDDVE